ncbi:MAG: asparagine synthase (glutamine-hydrolyzing) [Candidatus Cyclobacteriaceae bacterium M2_1C_046]
MCGITGFINYGSRISHDVIANMVSSLRHRGPDDSGFVNKSFNSSQVGLGHTRLSIIDLSVAGHQPMQYRQWLLVFNGEIYNYKEIKILLEQKGHSFHSNSDTEMILHAFEEWGVKCVERFIGMFAFVILDQDKEILYTFRDRAGVKPFFYYRDSNVFIFSSELKSFHEHPHFHKKIDGNALESYFQYGYIPSPHCIFSNSYKLEPGHYLKINIKTKEVSKNCYWNAANYYNKPKLSFSYDEAKYELLKLLKSAFNYRLVADVPVGIFLSGGYDSTAVAAILQKDNKRKLKTFSIGFEEGNNEAPYAKETASFLRTDHHELICTSQEAQDIVMDLPDFYDEPFADSSAIPTVLVSRFARKHVTVALSADGGDEIFGGYTRYFTFKKYFDFIRKIPNNLSSPSIKVAQLFASFVPDEKIHWKHQLQSFSEVLLEHQQDRRSNLLYKKMHLMPSEYINKLLNQSVSPVSTEFDKYNDIQDILEHPQLIDYKMYLPDDILTKVDRATMSCSLEGREPLLDHRIIEFAARLPLEYKMKNNIGKNILKDIVHDYVPRKMLDRPKSGFSIPLSSWFKNELSFLITENLNYETVKKAGVLNPQFVTSRIKEFNLGNLHYTPLIYKLLMFQMWYKKWY